MGTFDINNGFYSLNEPLFIQGLNKLDTFVGQFEQAMMQFPQDDPGWLSFESFDEDGIDAPELEALIESGDLSDLLELVD